MTSSTQVRRPSATTRRAGYLVAAAVNVAMLYLVNVQPGWEAVPFLTDAVPRVLPLVNASIVAGLVVNLVYLAYDAASVRSLGDLTTGVVGLAALVSVWRTFPFAFSDSSFDWALLVRLVLALAIGGTVLGTVVVLASLARRLGASGSRDTERADT
jgi:hypothetical protein